MAQINIRIDEELKKEFEEVLSEIGLTQTDVVIDAVKYVVKNRRTPFMKTELVKTAEEVKQDLITKITRVHCVIGELNGFVLTSKPVEPNHLNIIIETLQEYLITYNTWEHSIDKAMLDMEIRVFRSAYNQAMMLFTSLTKVKDSIDPALMANIDFMMSAFKDAMEIRQSCIKILIKKLKKNNITVSDDVAFIEQLSAELTQGSTFADTVVRIVSQGNKRGFHLALVNPLPHEGIGLHNDLKDLGFSVTEIKLIIQNLRLAYPMAYKD